MTLSIRDTLHFGKFKGMNVGKMLLEDPSWACWIREEKKKADPRDLTFDIEVNDMIDVAIERSRSLKKKYTPWKMGEKAAGDALIKDKAERAAKDVPMTPSAKITGREATFIIMDELDGIPTTIPLRPTGTKVWPATIASDFKKAIQKVNSANLKLSEIENKEQTARSEHREAAYAGSWGEW